MSENEKFAMAEDFIRSAMKHLSASVTEEDIKGAAEKAARSLPPYSECEDPVLECA